MKKKRIAYTPPRPAEITEREAIEMLTSDDGGRLGSFVNCYGDVTIIITHSKRPPIKICYDGSWTEMKPPDDELKYLIPLPRDAVLDFPAWMDEDYDRRND